MNFRKEEAKSFTPSLLSQKAEWLGRAVLVALCALTIWIYAAIISDIPLELGDWDASMAYYNLQVDGFRSGQLSLKQSVPPGLAQLADPYDPEANSPYRGLAYYHGSLHDLSYYHGRLFLYFGVTPALVLFWPAVAVTGHYMDHATAIVIFGAIGFIASVGLLYALWRRYFPGVSIVVVMALVMALGLANSLPLLLTRPSVWEVPISCGYAMVMLALAALWGAWHQPLRRGLWLALASLAYGLAIGARPSLLFGAVILLGPVIQTWNSTSTPGRRWRETMRMAAAALTPICAIGGGLLVYNYLRFDNPFEFGQSYQLAGDRQDNIRHFSLDNLWLNWRMYFWSLAEWRWYFPFLKEILPPDPNDERIAYGVLTNIPFVWLALAAPLVWRRSTLESCSGLRWFVVSVAVLFGLSALLMGLFYGTCLRYQTEFVPALVWLAVVGCLLMDHRLAAKRRGRIVFRCLGGVLLVYSIAFSLLYGYVVRGKQWALYGNALMMRGESRPAIDQFRKALRLCPGFSGVHIMLTVALCRDNQLAAAQAGFEQALKFLEPRNFARGYNDYADELIRNGHVDNGIAVLRAGLERVPDSARLNKKMGEVIMEQGRGQEARPYLEEALRLRPEDAEIHYDLGFVFAQEGKLEEAIDRWQEALRLDPDMFNAHYNFGTALLKLGREQEAVSHFKEALRIDPNNEILRERLRLLAAHGVLVQ